MSFFEELRRRNVLRAGLAYLAAVWVLIQVADVVLPNLGAPAWIIQALIYSSALGFPVLLILAWIYEWTPEGIRATSELGVTGGARLSGRRVDFAIIALLIVAVGFLLVRSPVPNEPTRLSNSIAVLPFENLSPDPNDDYFAAGLHEEILNQVAKLRDLSVISRSSVLRYAESELSIPEIGRELNVGTVMEGSVRYSDGRVRITTQLIDAATDEQLWSETYDREFSDIFAVESDIAMNIANALEAEYSLAEQASIERPPTDSPEAYALFLRLSTYPTLAQSLEYLDRAIELDPEFARAHANKAWRYAGRGREVSPDWERIAREAAERALELDPGLGSAYAALAFLHAANSRRAEAEAAFRRAIELDPNDTEVLSSYGRFKRYIGDHAEAVRLGMRAVELDPNNLVLQYQLGITYRYFGNYDAAADIFQHLIAANPTGFRAYLQLGYTEISRGNDDEAERQLRLGEELAPETGETTASRSAQIALAYAQLDRPDDVARLLEEVVEKSTENPVGNAVWAMAYLATRDYAQARQRLEAAVAEPTRDFIRLAEIQANTYDDPELEKPEFQALFERLWNDE